MHYHKPEVEWNALHTWSTQGDYLLSQWSDEDNPKLEKDIIQWLLEGIDYMPRWTRNHESMIGQYMAVSDYTDYRWYVDQSKTKNYTALTAYDVQHEKKAIKLRIIRKTDEDRSSDITLDFNAPHTHQEICAMLRAWKKQVVQNHVTPYTKTQFLNWIKSFKPTLSDDKPYPEENITDIAYLFKQELPKQWPELQQLDMFELASSCKQPFDELLMYVQILESIQQQDVLDLDDSVQLGQ